MGNTGINWNFGSSGTIAGGGIWGGSSLALAEVAMAMVIVALAVGVVLVALMVAIYRYGDRVVPEGKR